MPHLTALVVSCVLFVTVSGLQVLDATAQTESAGGSDVERPDAPSFDQDDPATPGSETATVNRLYQAIVEHPWWTTLVALLTVLIVIGGGVLLYNNSATDIHNLMPSFFFWLGMIYLGLLLLSAVVYISCFASFKLIGGILPIGVPWFGALGAVMISLEGVFLWNRQWDNKYNHWHIGRPLFGAVLGIVAFFIFVLIVTAAGTPPRFLVPSEQPSPSDFIVYYVVAFLVGYREQTFRELIKRATDLILQPTTPPLPSPAVTFNVGGATPGVVNLPPSAPTQTSSQVVSVHNAGNAPLLAPAVAVSVTAPAPPGTFAILHDQVTGGGDLAPGQFRTVEVTFTPQGAQAYAGTLTVTATNLPAPSTIPLSGTGT